MGEHRWATFEQKTMSIFTTTSPASDAFASTPITSAAPSPWRFASSTAAVAHPFRVFLPEVVSKLTHLPRGLILVTGPTGGGKSTTLAAMIDAINHRDQGHIVTLEDPIEFTFQNDKCLIEQREVGIDVPDFASGLRHVLRQDPDVFSSARCAI